MEKQLGGSHLHVSDSGWYSMDKVHYVKLEHILDGIVSYLLNICIEEMLRQLKTYSF